MKSFNQSNNDAIYESGLIAQGSLDVMDDYNRQAIEKYGRLMFDQGEANYREMLEIVCNNLERGISKSIQKLQARAIREVLSGDYS